MYVSLHGDEFVHCSRHVALKAGVDEAAIATAGTKLSVCTGIFGLPRNCHCLFRRLRSGRGCQIGWRLRKARVPATCLLLACYILAQPKYFFLAIQSSVPFT